MMSSWTSVAVWMISTTDASFTAPSPLYPRSFAERSNSAGRIRLPPPARRYSPISVIAATFETVWRPNCSSIATRSSRSRSKISFPLMAVVALKSIYRRDAEIAGAERSPIRVLNESQTRRPLRLDGRICSVRPVIRELHINSKVVLLHQGDDFLQRVAVLTADPHYVALDGSLHFLFRVFDQFHDLACLLDRDPLLHGDLLLDGASRGRFDRSVRQTFQRHAAFDQFLL